MSIIDMFSKVTTVYKADTTQHRLAIRELSGDQKKAAQEELKRIEAGNAGIDNQVKKLGKLAIVVGAVGVAAKVAFDSLEFAGRRADLQATANIESMEGLKKATRGLMTETQLLEAAAKIQQGTMKLSQKEMESVTGAMTALGEKGNDAAAVTEAFTTALVTGKTKGLKAFGIEVYEGGNRLETHNAILAKAAELTKDFSKESLDGADKMSQAKVKFADATDNLKVSIGKAAESLTPLVTGFSSLVQSLTDVGAIGPVAIGALALAITGNPAIAAIIALGSMDGAADSEDLGNTKGALFGEKYNTHRRDRVNRQMGLGGLEASQRLNQQVLGLRPVLDGEMTVDVKDLPGTPRKGKGGPGPYDRAADAYSRSIAATEALQDALIQAGFASADALDEAAATQRREHGDASRTAQAGRDKDSSDSLELTRERLREVSRVIQETSDFMEMKNAGPTLGERLFGSVTEIDAYKESWSALTGVVGEGYDMMVDGATDIGKAIKMSVADSIKAIGKKMMIRGLEETAEGVSALAGIATAGLAPGHFLAAGKWFAGAAIAGYTANAIGTTGGAAVTAAAAAKAEKDNKPGAPSSSGSSASGGGSGGPIIVYGDQFADDSPRNRQRTAQKLVAAALGTSGGTYS